MLPVSGAAQLKAIGATTGERPISSQSIPYSQLVSPAPCSSSGRNRFQRPCSRAFSRMPMMISGYATPGSNLRVERLHRLGLDRIDVLVHEAAHAAQQLLQSAAELEVHWLSLSLEGDGLPYRLPPFASGGAGRDTIRARGNGRERSSVVPAGHRLRRPPRQRRRELRARDRRTLRDQTTSPSAQGPPPRLSAACRSAQPPATHPQDWGRRPCPLAGWRRPCP